MFLTNVSGATFIPGATSIPESRVSNYNFFIQNKQKLLTLEITIGGQTINFNDLLDEVPDLGFKKKMKVKIFLFSFLIMILQV